MADLADKGAPIVRRGQHTIPSACGGGGMCIGDSGVWATKIGVCLRAVVVLDGGQWAIS